MPKNQSESALQSACINWFRYQYPKLIMFAIPNGGQRSEIGGAILKREGVLAGVSDLFLMEPRGVFHGMFIEMKTPDNYMTEKQKLFFEQATLRGYKCVCCKTNVDFRHEVEAYLKLK